ncbi:MAG: hypothetical protein ABIO67_01165 [Mycobacteriales bacterium]
MAKRDSSEQMRRFGPLTSLVVAAVLAFLVLPSTLTLPNPSPTSQEEIAPVPPTQTKSNPPVSNFTGLSAATSGNGLGVGDGGGNKPATGPIAPPPLPAGLGNVPPSTYQCVAGRQTEDPLSPTCVPFYQGDNGGPTYQGVTAKEVRIVLYYEPFGSINTSQGTSTPPYNTIVDTDLPPKPNEHPSVSTARGWSKFFGQRYAAYNRHVRIYVQFGSYDSSSRTSAGTQAQDAALAYAKVKPFAVVNYAQFGNGTFYNNYMAQHGVLNFGSIAVRSAKFYSDSPGQQWGYGPPLEYRAAQYANFVCTSLKGKTTKDVGSTSTGISNGVPRVYGLYYTTDPAFEGITDEAKLARDLITKQCGITPKVEQAYAKNSFSVDNGTTPRSATNAALAFQQKGVTTILWPAGYEVKLSAAMKSLNYFPEMVLGDDDQQASTQGGGFQDPAVWDQAWIVSSQTYDPPANDRICVQEYRTVDQQSPAADVTQFACETYNDLRQLYTGIQVAGPNLTPKSVDQGFHAIPLVESTNPQLPTCYYLSNDYTCVKDSIIQHWDSTARTESNPRTQGCWRMVGNGKRYLPQKFPGTDFDAMNNPRDICNEFSTSANLSTAPGTA